MKPVSMQLSVEQNIMIIIFYCFKNFFYEIYCNLLFTHIVVV